MCFYDCHSACSVRFFCIAPEEVLLCALILVRKGAATGAFATVVLRPLLILIQRDGRGHGWHLGPLQRLRKSIEGEEGRGRGGLHAIQTFRANLAVPGSCVYRAKIGGEKPKNHVRGSLANRRIAGGPAGPLHDNSSWTLMDTYSPVNVCS